MPALNPCPSCGSEVFAASGGGQCPRCLMELALSPEESPRLTDAGLGTGRTFGNYQLGRQLGSGGMGVVYQATRLSDGATVAIKLLRDLYAASPAQLRRFELEAQAVSRLDHPNIVRVHEVGECEGHPFLSMEFIEGSSLSDVILQTTRGSDTRTKRPLDLARQRDMARFMMKTARAVEHAHLRGVLHRDLKPANILVDAGGEPRLTDFGLAKLLAPTADEPPRSSLTGTGDAPGTPGFMAPEQVRHGGISEATDIYGLGAVLYAWVTGHPPFHTATPLELFRHIVEMPPTLPSNIQTGVHRDLETICLKCLEKNPRYRYPSAGELARDLERFASGQPVQARRASPWRRGQQWVRRNPAGMAVITSLGLGLAAALVLLKVVNDQRREIELDRDQTFDEGMQRVSQIWRDPETEAVTISARELAILAGRSPATVRGAQRQLTLAVRADDGPSSMAQRYARLLAGYQERLQQDSGQKIAFQLRLLKRSGVDAARLLGGEVDLLALNACDLHRHPSALEASEIIGVAETTREGVLFTRTNVGLTSLKDLVGRSVLFPDPALSLTVLAKARLAGAGLRAKDLRPKALSVASAESGQSPLASSEIITRVLRGEADVGVCHRSLFERHRHQGLVLLDQFPEAPKVLAVRRDLDPLLVDALRRALAAAELRSSWPESTFLPLASEDGSTSDDSVLRYVRNAIQQAELFDSNREGK